MLMRTLEKGTCVDYGGNVNCYSHYGNYTEFSQKIEKRTTILTSTSTPGYSPPPTPPPKKPDKLEKIHSPLYSMKHYLQ